MPEKHLVTPTLLDRLIDGETHPSGGPDGGLYTLGKYARTLQRDLELLLNTRQTWAEPLIKGPETINSIMSFGIPDVMGQRLRTIDDRKNFANDLKNIILRHDPRFENLRVEMASSSQAAERILHFRISARVRIGKSPRRVVFDTTIEPATGNARVELTDE